MPAKDFGTKHTCFKCSTKFYDLRKPEPVCPKCGADQREATAKTPAESKKASRLSAVPKAAEPEIEPVAKDDDEEFDESDDEDEDVDTDDDDDA